MNGLIRIGIAAAVVAAGAVMVYAGGKRIGASGDYKTFSDVEVKSGFRSVTVNGNITVNYTPTSGKTSVSITAPENLIGLVELENKNNRLTVKYKYGYNVVLDDDSVVVNVASPNVSDFQLNGSGDIRIKKNLKTSNFNAELNGSGDICMGEVEASALKMSLNGSGDIRMKKMDSTSATVGLSGSGDIKIGEVSATASLLSLKGSGDLNVGGVESSNCTAILSGSGDLNVGRCKSTAFKVDLNGLGDIACRGIESSTLAASIKGSGDIELRGKANTAYYSVDKSGSIDAGKLEAGIVTARVKGSGNISCHVTQVLNSSISGSGSVDYSGNPKVTSSGTAPEKVKH